MRKKYPHLYDLSGNCIFECKGEFITPEEEFQLSIPVKGSLLNAKVKRAKICCMACAKFRVCPVACDVIKHFIELGFGK